KTCQANILKTKVKIYIKSRFVMLWFIGFGISGLDGTSISALQVLKKANVVYFENFTSPIGKSDLVKIKKLVKGRFVIAPRWMVEDGKTILADAESAITSLIGECGIHYYKMGKPVTIMKEIASMNTVYYTLYENMLKGSHTMFILEYNSDANFFLNPKDALVKILETEKEQKRNVIDESTFAIIASRIGSKNQSITAGKLSKLIKYDFGKPPHTIIIPGRLHFTEHDALKTFAKCLDEPFDNSSKIQKISDQMLHKYVPKARKALEEVVNRFSEDKNLQPVIENAQLYLDDAEKFQKEGKEELAILSVGYAEGLIDALRLSKGIDPWT